jgi:DNA-binding transcriptional LysR family regulator
MITLEDLRFIDALERAGSWDVAPFVKSGELKRILTDWDFDGADVLALVPARQGISARVARFVEFLKAHFHPKPPWR